MYFCNTYNNVTQSIKENTYSKRIWLLNYIFKDYFLCETFFVHWSSQHTRKRNSLKAFFKEVSNSEQKNQLLAKWKLYFRLKSNEQLFYTIIFNQLSKNNQVEQLLFYDQMKYFKNITFYILSTSKRFNFRVFRRYYYFVHLCLVCDNRFIGQRSRPMENKIWNIFQSSCSKCFIKLAS